MNTYNVEITTMTNKESIIIDGVDVRGCEHEYNAIDWETAEDRTGCMATRSKQFFCDERPNCYYKQLARKERECEELKEYKKKVDYLHSFLRNKYNYGSFKPMWGAYLLKHLFNEDLEDFFDKKAYEMADTIEEKEKEIDHYKQALEKIEDYIKNKTCWEENDVWIKIGILDIINEAEDDKLHN